jgi:hypothetical protein
MELLIMCFPTVIQKIQPANVWKYIRISCAASGIADKQLSYCLLYNWQRACSHTQLGFEVAVG